MLPIQMFSSQFVFKSAIIDRKAKVNLFWMLDDRVDGAISFVETFPEGTVILASDTMLRNR